MGSQKKRRRSNAVTRHASEREKLRRTVGSRVTFVAQKGDVQLRHVRLYPAKGVSVVRASLLLQGCPQTLEVASRRDTLQTLIHLKYCIRIPSQSRYTALDKAKEHKGEHPSILDLPVTLTSPPLCPSVSLFAASLCLCTNQQVS